ncbi:MAG: hypothetical protein L3J00_03060 [Thiomicrorhabdus sp.]|nr:hypothetical protein [Thiomicrorhabdus sp.]
MNAEVTETAIEMKNVIENLAQEILLKFDPSEKSLSLLHAEHSPAEFLNTLIDQELYDDAVTFLAHALPVREAIWWSYLCSKEHFDQENALYQQGALATENWVKNPTEENRRDAENWAEAGKYNTVTSWTAAAVFWSGGSIAPEGQPVMEPPLHLYAHAISGAIVMSANHNMPAVTEVTQRYQRYLKLGIDIANGENS